MTNLALKKNGVSTTNGRTNLAFGKFTGIRFEIICPIHYGTNIYSLKNNLSFFLSKMMPVTYSYSLFCLLLTITLVYHSMSTNELTIDTTSNVNNDISINSNVTVQHSSSLLSDIITPIYNYLFLQEEVVFKVKEESLDEDDKTQSNRINKSNNNNVHSSTMSSAHNTALASNNLNIQAQNSNTITLLNVTIIYSVLDAVMASVTAGKLYTKQIPSQLITRDLLTFCAMVFYKQQEPFWIININTNDPKQLDNN